jgi:dolichyl-diphosphooligosaccharide--protein glycosyltransferase
MLWLGWFSLMFLGGLFARRLFLYALPAICIMSGLGLAFLFDWGKVKPSRADLEMAFVVAPKRLLTYAKTGVGMLLILLLLLVSLSAYRIGSDPRVAVNNDWQAALRYLKDDTPQAAVVMSWWDYGYWILDVAERDPVVDNGVHPETTDRDIAVLYVTTDDSAAAGLMQRYGATYLVFSTLEYQILPYISQLGLGQPVGDGQSIPEEMRDSLYSRAITGDLEFGGGLERVYPNPEVETPAVVILRLE